MIAKTLVHKAALPVALESVRTFAACSLKQYSLEIHSDGSLDAEDLSALCHAAGSMETTVVEPSDRKAVLAECLSNQFPLSSSLLKRGAYMSKLEVLASADKEFFYFDSDIIWLRPFEAIAPAAHVPAVFSTETWSWYYGIQKPWRWIANRTPARVNSGFTFLRPPFRFAKLEAMLRDGLYNPDHEYATDQEILAYLYPDCKLFSLCDFARSRVGKFYDLSKLDCFALHYPGGMWKQHLEIIKSFKPHDHATPHAVARTIPYPFQYLEYFKMRILLLVEKSIFLQPLANQYRRIRKILN